MRGRKFVQGRDGRFVDIEVQIEQRHQQVRIARQVVRNGDVRVSLDEVDLGDPREIAVLVELLHASAQFVGDVIGFREVSRRHIARAAVVRVHGREAFEGVEPDDRAAVVVGLERGRQLRPRHDAATVVDAAFHDAALHVQDLAEKLRLHQQPGELLPADVLREVLQPVLHPDTSIP
jgi:hypothetical protein